MHQAVFGVLAGRRRDARWKWHVHHQRTPTRAAHKMQFLPPQHGLTQVSHAVGRPAHGGPWLERMWLSDRHTSPRWSAGNQDTAPHGAVWGVDGGADVATMLPC